MAQKVGTVTSELILDTRKASQAYRRFEQTVARGRGRDNFMSGISADAKDFENSLGKATNRVVAFGAAAAVFTTLAKAASAFADSVIEVDNSLAKINVNLGQSAEGLKKFGADLFNIARQTGQTFEVTAKAAEELARQGLGAEETTKRLKDALILSRIAGLDSASAVETLTAAINSFNQEALTSTEVVNKFAAVDTKFAVSSKDLAEAVSRVGSTAQSAGVGLNELIGLVTSLQQTTARGGATIGNGLKTIFTRIQAAPETINALQSIGVAIKNTDGSLRDAISILRDYGAARQNLGEVERASLDRTVAGTFQINILKAALADLSKEYSVYGNAVRTASGATDEAIRKNEQLNQTLSSLINSTSQSIKQFFASVGSQELGPALQDILKLFERARAFFSGDSGDVLGKSLGEGILKGISNVLSGPALAALFFILGSAFKKVASTILAEARTLLTINNIVQTRANIQKQINILLANATDAERAQYVAASSVLAKKEQILAIQARINQEELAGNPLVRSFEVRGSLGQVRGDPRIRRGSGYGIPNVANPIASAIAREKAAGVPASQIYVDRDARVASFANPLGILVANRRDEPLGGYQGVNRVLSEGGNPKMAGMTPNFAPLKSSKDLALERFGLKKTYEGAALSAAQIAMNSTKSLTTATKKLEKTVLDLNKSFEPLLKQASVAAAMRPGTQFSLIGDQSPLASETLTPQQAANVRASNRVVRRAERFSEFSIGSRLVGKEQRNNGPSLAEVAAKENRERRNRNIALGAAFALPFAAGFIPQGQGGTAGGIAGGATSGALQGAGIGGIFGPKGLAVGALIGGIAGIFSKLNKSAAELGEALEEAAAQRNAESEAIGRVIALREQIKDARDQGLSPSIIRKLDNQLNEASNNVTSNRGRAVLNAAPGKQQDDATEKLRLQNALDDAFKNVTDIVSGRASGNISRAIQGGFNQDVLASLTPDKIAALGRAGSGKFNVAAVGDSETGSIINIDEVVKAEKDFKKALQDASPVLSQFVDISLVTKENLNELAQATASAALRFKSVLKDEERFKTPSSNRLLPGAFLNRPNLDVFSQAAFAGRSPSANRGQKAQSRFDFFNELSNADAAGFDKDSLKGNALFQKASAGVQGQNIGDILIRFLQANNPSTGRLRDERGNPAFDAIQRTLEIVAQSGTENGQLAKEMLKLIPALKNTLSDAKVNPLNQPMSNSPNFSSGLVAGVGYSTYAGAGKTGRGANFITSDTVKYNTPASSTNYINKDNLKYNIPAGNGKPFDLTKNSKAPSEQDSWEEERDAYLKIAAENKAAAEALSRATQEAIKIVVNVEGGGDPVLLAQIEYAITDLYRRQAAAGGKPLPPSARPAGAVGNTVAPVQTF